MRILVPIKRVAGYDVKVRVKPDSTGADTADIKMSMNPFDEVVVEEIVRLKEKGAATEAVVISRRVAQCQGTLCIVMTIGADRGILVEMDTELQPLAAVKLLKVLANREQPTLVLLDKQAIDDDANQTGQTFTALADLSQTTCASKTDVIGNKVIVTREVDGGLETVSLTLPAMITMDLCSNEPRYVTLPNTMKVKKKPFDTVRPENLSVDMVSRLKTLGVNESPKRGAGVMVADVVTLMEKLKSKAKVI